METSSPQIKTEQNSGVTSVALFQSMPKSCKDLINDETLLIQMLKINGMEEVTSFKLGEVIKGTMQHCQKATISFSAESGKEDLEVFVKFNKLDAPNADVHRIWREAYFYARILPKYVKDLKAPKAYLALIDKEQNQEFLVLELIKETISAQDILMASYMQKDLSEYGTDCNMEATQVKLAVELAKLHAATFVGKANEVCTMMDDEQIVQAASWMKGKGKQSFEEATDSIRAMFETSLVKSLPDDPTIAIVKASLNKVDFDAYQEEIKNGVPCAMSWGQKGGSENWGFSKAKQDIFMTSFTKITFQPITVDLANLLIVGGDDMRKMVQDNVLKAYHEKFCELSGSSVYTLEKLTNDVEHAILISSVILVSEVCKYLNAGYLIHFVGHWTKIVEQCKITSENVAPAIICGYAFFDKSNDKAEDFDLQMETKSDNTQKVKLFQPMPFTVDQSVQDGELIQKLLVANGMSDLAGVELVGKEGGFEGMSQEVQVGFCWKQDGSKIKILIKANRPQEYMQKQWREAMFYADIYQETGMEEFRKVYPLPNIYLVMIDKEAGRQLMIMDCLEENFTNYQNIIACGGGECVKIGAPSYSLDKSVEEVCGAGSTKMDAFHSLIDRLAALHYFHWNDKSMFEKFPYLKCVEQYQGLKGEEYLNSLNEQCAHIKTLVGPDGSMTKVHPELAAVFKACADKGQDWNAFLDVYVKGTPFTMTHGDPHERQAVWSLDKKQAFLFDYELVGVGPAVFDLCYMFQAFAIQFEFEDEDLLKHYHKTLLSFGDKVTAETYPYDQLLKDYIRFFIPKTCILTSMIRNFMGDAIYSVKQLEKSAAFVKKYGITPENVEPAMSFT